MILRSLPIFVALMAFAALTHVLNDRPVPQASHLVAAIAFAAAASLAIRFYWDKRREQRRAVIERARKRSLDT